MIAGSDRGRSAPALSVRLPQRKPRQGVVWGATARPPGFRETGGFAVNALHVGGGVMVRANWSRIATRKRIRRQGVEDVKGATPIAVPPPKQPRRKLSKAELREQAAAAFLAWRAGQAPKDK